MSYSEKLKTEEWQDKRLRILNRDNFKCQHPKCSSLNNEYLEVHHKYYLPNRNPWEYQNEALVSLCFDCHDSEDLFRAIVFDNLPKFKRKKAIELLNAGMFNNELYFLCVGQFAKSIPMRISDIVLNLKTPIINNRWDCIIL